MKKKPAVKSTFHPRNKHREQYDFKQLVASCSELSPFVLVNEHKETTIDFFNPMAVKMLNKALLKHYYQIENWDIPKNYLCPPIPGRADYIHYIADLLSDDTTKKIPIGKKVKCLDIGVGANCVYPIIGLREYGWSFVGADIDLAALQAAHHIVRWNPNLKGKINLRMQEDKRAIFHGIIQKKERFDCTMCNPPFHASLEEAQAGTARKQSNLKGKKIKNPTLNFGGQSNELWCEGGETAFVENMILESKNFADSCTWFTTLISKESNLKNAYAQLEKVEATAVKTIPMTHGNKKSRILAWSYRHELIPSRLLVN